MMFPYKDFVLEIEPVKGEDIRLIAECKELGYRISGSYDYVTFNFKEYVDSYLGMLEKEESREVPDLLKSIDENLEQMRQDFKKAGLAFNIFGDNQKKESEELEVEPCIAFVQQMLKDFPDPEQKKHLHNLLFYVRNRLEKYY